jgi:mono/diheme cytochrome c family protein
MNSKFVPRAGRMIRIGGLIAVLIAGGHARGESPSGGVADDAKPADALAKALFAKHCQVCHSGEKPKGDFAVATLSPDFADKENRERWLKVLDQVKDGTMPPKEKPRPPAHEVKALTDWISRQVTAAESARSASQGRVVLRRLNRNEYRNTVRDLLGVEVDLQDVLPIDDVSNGFDNSAESLHMSAYLMENYLEAANRVLDAAIASGPRPPTNKKRYDIKDEQTVKPNGSVYRHVDDGVAIFSSWVSANIQVTMWNFQTRGRGRYRFRISGYGYQTEKPVTFHVMAGPMNAAAQQYLIDYFDVPADEPTVVEFTEPMETAQTIRIIVDRLGVIPPDVEKVGADNYKGPGLVVQWVEIEGPLLDSWPPPSHRQIFGDLKQVPAPDADNPNRREVVSDQPLVDAERILRDFARRAFRRSVTDEDITPFLARVRAKLDQGSSFEQAMRVGLRGVLVSPHFLFLREKTGSENRLLDNFALASRLSYFLWSSMPDEELFKFAEQGALFGQRGEPEGVSPRITPSDRNHGAIAVRGLTPSGSPVLRQQVERMLRDPKARAFTDNFASQWLTLRNIDATMPDRMLYPEFDDVLKVSSVKETLLFFDEVLKNDLSLTNFVASDFTMLNGPLAKLYGIPGVDDSLEFRKVSLPPDSHRGGVLTMASVLKVTANGTTTSPILRGAWVLDRILGTPPPKPTMDVEAIDPDIRGATTIRNQLEKHRTNAACASCHVKIDPPGFALENFDVIGGWRDHYRSIGDGEPVILNGRRVRYRHGPPVDSADVLPDGRRFQNIDEFKQLLLTDKDQLARALAEKLLAYATGAAPTTADQPEIDAIVYRIRDKNYGFRTLVHEVVQSELFRRK